MQYPDIHIATDITASLRACSSLLAQAQQRAQRQGITAEQLRELLAWPSTPVPGLSSVTPAATLAVAPTPAPVRAPSPAPVPVPEITSSPPTSPQPVSSAQATPAPSPASVQSQAPMTPAVATSPSSHLPSSPSSARAGSSPGNHTATLSSPPTSPPSVTPGVLAVCNASTEAECLHGPLYGTVDTPRNHSTMSSIGIGTTMLWFYNLDTQLIHGPFVATGSPAMNLDPQAFTGAWPRAATGPSDASSPTSRPTRFKLQVPIAAHAKHADLSCAHISQLSTFTPHRVSELPCTLSSAQVQQLLAIQEGNVRNPDALNACISLPVPKRSPSRRGRSKRSGPRSGSLAL